MAITFVLHPIPKKLPPAKLYLDDIREIWQILTESCDEPQTVVMAGKSQCDTLDDLPEIGGRTTNFKMEIASPGRHHALEIMPFSTEIHIHETGDQLMAWSRYVKVAAIFEKRKQRLKWLGRACAPWIAGGMWVISVVASRYVAVPRNLTFSAWVHLGTVAALTVSVLYYFASSHSIVYLRTPHRFAWRRWLDDHKPEVVVGLAGALLGTLAARSLEKSLEITFHSTQLFLR